MQVCTWIVTGLVAVLCGCTVHGKWNMKDIEPTAAIRDFDFSVITLQEDGTYYAERNMGGIRTTSGTYRFDGRLLVLDPHDGEALTFDATLSGDGRRLVVGKFWRDQKVKAVFARKGRV